MTEKEHKRKLTRLEWLMDKADDLDTKIYDDEIEALSKEIEAFENKEFDFSLPNPVALVEFHIERLGIEQQEMATHLGINRSVLNRYLRGVKDVTPKHMDLIYDFDFNSIKKIL